MSADLPEGFLLEPASRPSRVLFSQQWQDLAFIHWAVDPEVVAGLLPAGTYPDVFDGKSYVGLVPFLMRNVRWYRSGPVPYFGDFPETNVRLYSVDDAGRHGVVFCSLESSRLATTLVARTGYQIPYTWAQMRIARHGVRMRYVSTRRWPQRGLESGVTIDIGPRLAEPTSLDQFLTARWGLHAEVRGRTVWWPNWHAPWVLHEATATGLRQDLTTAAGLPELGEPDVPTRWAPGVRTIFGPAEPI